MADGLAGSLDTLRISSLTGPCPQALVGVTVKACPPSCVHSILTLAVPCPDLITPPLVSQMYSVPACSSTSYSSTVFKQTAPLPTMAVTCSGSTDTNTSNAAGIPLPQLFLPRTITALRPGVSHRINALAVP